MGVTPPCLARKDYSNDASGSIQTNQLQYMKEMISKRIEVTFEATKIHQVIERCDPRRYGALLSYSEETTTITKVFELSWAGGIMWRRHLMVEFPHIYGYDKLRIVKCHIIEFIDEPLMKRHHRHGLVLGDPRYRDNNEILDF